MHCSCQQRRPTTWLAAMLVLTGLFGLPAAAAPDVELETVTLQLKWHHSFQFAGYYAAKWKGYYREEGLDVRFLEGRPETYSTGAVVDGSAQYGVQAAGLLYERLQGTPVVALAAIFQHSPYIVLTRADSGIVAPADLVGARIMESSHPTFTELKAMLLREGVSPETLQFVEHTQGLEALIDGRVDAVSAYLTNEPRLLREAGVEPRVIRPIDYGVDFYGDCLFTLEHELGKHPERVAAMRRASLRGWEYAMNHVDEMVEVIAAMPGVAERGMTTEHLLYQAEEMRKLIRPRLVEIGHMNPGRWRRMADTYVELGIAEPGYSLDGFLYDPRPRPSGHWLFILAGCAAGVILVGLLAWVWTGQLRRAVRRSTAQLRVTEEGLRNAVSVGSRLRALLVDLNQCNRLEEMLAPLLAAAADVSGMEGVAIYVVQDDRVVLRCHRSLPEDFVEETREKSLSDPLVQDVACQEHVADLCAMSVSSRERLNACGLRHGYSVPLHAGGELFGFLNVATRTDRAPEPAQLHALSLLAVEAASALSRLKVEEEHRRLTLAMEQTAEQIIITDVNGTILYVNPAFERVTGYTREEAAGKNPRILKSGHQDAVFYRDMWAQLCKGETWAGRLINKRKDGTLYTEDASIAPMRDASGRIVNYVGVKRDITHEIELEEQLRQSQKMEAVGQLAGGMAHDFNNLLQVILGYTSLLLSEAGANDAFRPDIEQVHEAAARASKLTGQLLTFSRRQVMEQVRLDLNDVIDKLSTMLKGMIGANIELVSLPGDNLWITKADRGQLEQILINLCANARDAMPDGGRLVIETRNVAIDSSYARTHTWARGGRYVMLRIADNGCGMDTKTRLRMFDPFFTTKEIGRGTGMGLATVYGIVTQHRGLIHAESREGEGTEFQIYFPVEGGVVASELQKPSEPVSEGGNETILVAEDEDAVRMLTVKVLQGAGYEVLTARDGEAALQILEERGAEIGLALVDVVMPVLGGRAVNDVIVKKYPHIQVLFVSGYSPGSVHTNFILDQGLGLIKKPFKPNELLRRVRECLRHADDAATAE